MTGWKRLEFLENSNEETHMNQPFCSMALQTAIGSFPHFTFSSSLKFELRRGEQNCCAPTCVYFSYKYSCIAVDSCQRTFHFQLHSMFEAVVK